MGVGDRVEVDELVGAGVGVEVAAGVLVGVLVAVRVEVGVLVGSGVPVGADVGVVVMVGVGEAIPVAVAVGLVVGVGVGSCVGEPGIKATTCPTFERSLIERVATRSPVPPLVLSCSSPIASEIPDGPKFHRGVALPGSVTAVKALPAEGL